MSLEKKKKNKSIEFFLYDRYAKDTYLICGQKHILVFKFIAGVIDAT